MTEADLRAEVAAWSRADLEGLAIDLLRKNPEVRDTVVRQIVAKRGAAAATALFMDQVDAALDVDEVTWKQVMEYSCRLHALVDDVRKLGEADPPAAVEVARHFLATIPSVFECVDAEDELGQVCNALAETLLALARPSGVGLGHVAAELLDAFDADGYGNMGEFPKLVAASPRAKEERAEIESLLRERARAYGPDHRARRLEEAAEAVGTIRKSRRS